LIYDAVLELGGRDWRHTKPNPCEHGYQLLMIVTLILFYLELNFAAVRAVSAMAQPAEISGGTGLSGRQPELLLLVLAQILHVQVACRLEPVLVHLDREMPDPGAPLFR
jgi:hypothetical protein